MIKLIVLQAFALMLIPGFSSAQKTGKKPVPKKDLYAEYKKQFSFVDDPAPIKFLKIKPDSVKYTPRHFYITQVNDSTGNNDSIGFTLRPKSGKPQKLSFEGGTKEAISIFFDKKLAKDTTLLPIIFNVSKFLINEEREKPYDKTTVSYRYEFFYPYKNKLERIASYNGQGYLFTPIGMKKKFDSLITVPLGSLEKQFVAMDEMLDELNKKSPMFCKGVKLTATFRTGESLDMDTLFYNPAREITWDDFKGETRGAENTFGSYVAMFYEGDDIDYSNNYYNLTVHIGASFIKSASWVGSNVKNKTILSHMNYRLKLAGLHAIKFKNQLESATFTCDNFQSEIRALYAKAFKELNVAVNEFDRDTNYGQIKREENRWQQMIEDQFNDIKK